MYRSAETWSLLRVERPSAVVEDWRAREASGDRGDCWEARRVAKDSARATCTVYVSKIWVNDQVKE